MAKPTGLCYLCGVNPATSWDHTPPKSLFPTASQIKGHKLPACSDCNNLLSKDEEYIRDYFTIAGHHPAARQVFLEGTKRSYLRPYELVKTVTKLDRINRDLVPVKVVTPGGVVVGMETGIKIDTRRVKPVVVKITKGLYWYHTKQRIPDDYHYDFYFQPPDVLPALLERKTPLVGRFGDVFCYKGILSKDDQFTGIWWVAFYRTFGAIVVVENPRLATEIANDRKAHPTKKSQ